MEVEAARRDAATLDPELLQLPELAPGTLRENPALAEALFSQWLALPEASKLVKSLIEDAKGGAPLNVAGNSTSANATANGSLPSMFPAGSAPPLSPRSMSGSPRVMRRGFGVGPSSLGSPLKLVSEPVKQVIPQFYFKSGCPPPKDLKEQCLSRTDHLFFGGEGLHMQEFRLVTKEICKLPSFFSSVLFKKIDVGCTGIVTRYREIHFEYPDQGFQLLFPPNKKDFSYWFKGLNGRLYLLSNAKADGFSSPHFLNLI